jgi:hypothetical protein
MVGNTGDFLYGYFMVLEGFIRIEWDLCKGFNGFFERDSMGFHGIHWSC